MSELEVISQKQMYDIFVNIHVLSVVGMMGIILFNLYSTLKDMNKYKYYTLIKKTTPALHTLNAFNIYAGMIIAFIYHLFDTTIFIMSAVSIVIIVMEAKRHKFMKKNLDNMTLIKDNAIKKYKIELALLFVTYMIVKVI